MADVNQSSYSQEALRVCRLSGASQKLAESNLLSLRDSEALLQQVIREGQRAASDHEKWRALELGARATLMVCDILIIGLESATGGAGTAVAKFYDGVKLVTGAALSGNIDPNTGWKMLAKNKAKIAELSAKGLGKNKLARSLELAQELVAYGEAMWEFSTGAASSDGRGNSGIKSSTTTATKQLERIRQKIREIEAELQSCELEEPTVQLLLG